MSVLFLSWLKNTKSSLHKALCKSFWATYIYASLRQSPYFHRPCFFLIYFLLKNNCFTEFFFFPIKPQHESAISSVHFSCSVVSNSLRPHESQHARPPWPPWSLPKPMPIESVMPSSHLILCHPLLLLPLIPPSIRVFFNESTLHMRWPKDWSFSFNISPSNEHPGLISIRMDWLDLLAVQGTLKSLLQHHSSKASILHC